MARAYRGPYQRPSSASVPYATAAVWGTGINPIHGYYGEGAPLRTVGRADALGGSPVSAQDGGGQQDRQSPTTTGGSNPPEELTWGYPVDYSLDAFGMGADSSPSDAAPAVFEYMDDRPAWGNDAPNQEIRATSTMTPWGRTGARLRAMRQGVRSYRVNSKGLYQPITAQQANQLPNETVSEGWLNKVTSFIADALPASDQQVFVQTSMRQRYLEKSNERAVARDTDAARTPIASRVEAMVRKSYSEGERLYDMFPFQAEEIIRPFHYRTAGLGQAEWMLANEYSAVTPVQRVPPPDPSMGIPEVNDPADYGYTGEDTMYYGG